MRTSFSERPIAALAILGLIAIPALFLSACQADLGDPEPLSLETSAALDVLPADAVGVAMVDMQEMQDNEFTNVFAPGRLSPEAMTGEAAARVLDFLLETGFDPQNDLHQVYASFSGYGLQGVEDATALLYGEFDRERIGDYMDTDLGSELTRGLYRDVATYTNAGSEGVYIALASDELIVSAATQRALEATLDRLAGEGSDALSSNTSLMDLASRTAGNTDAWVALEEMPPGMVRGGDDMGIGKTVGSFAAGMDAQDGGIEGRAFVTPAAGYAASDLESLVSGAIAGMRSAPDMTEEGRRVLDGVEVRTRDGGVSISGFVDNAVMQTVGGQ